MTNILPVIFIWLVLIGTLLDFAIADVEIGGFTFKGLVWFVPAVLSFVVIAYGARQIRFPVRIWAPWLTILIVSSLVVAPTVNIQYLVMLTCPLLIGIASSTVNLQRFEQEKMESWLDLYALTLAVVCALAIGISRLVNPGQSSHAAQLMTLTAIACIFAAKYTRGNWKAGVIWVILAALATVSLSRMAALATILTLPFTLAEMSRRRRALFAVIIGAVAWVAFSSDAFQQRFFFSGHGSLADLDLANTDLNTSGRGAVWAHLLDLVDDRPIFGYGLGTALDEVNAISFGVISHPHNDYIRLVYETGYLGVIVFCGCCIVQTWHAYKTYAIRRRNLFLLTGASCFVPFALYMSSDNILLYAAFYGNLMFLLLGLGYAAESQVPAKSYAAGNAARIRGFSRPRPGPNH